jgi:hypothetical protein
MTLDFKSPFVAKHATNAIGGIVTKYCWDTLGAWTTAPVFDQEGLFGLIAGIAVGDSGISGTEINGDSDAPAVHFEDFFVTPEDRLFGC